MDLIRETLDLWSAWLPQRNSHTIKIIKSILWDDQVEYLVLNFHFDPQGWSNRPFTMIKSIIFFRPSTDDEFDYLEGSHIVDHHIWSTWPSRYSGWPSIFLRVRIKCTQHFLGKVAKAVRFKCIIVYNSIIWNTNQLLYIYLHINSCISRKWFFNLKKRFFEWSRWKSVTDYNWYYK